MRFLWAIRGVSIRDEHDAADFVWLSQKAPEGLSTSWRGIVPDLDLPNMPVELFHLLLGDIDPGEVKRLWVEMGRMAPFRSTIERALFDGGAIEPLSLSELAAAAAGSIRINRERVEKAEEREFDLRKKLSAAIGSDETLQLNDVVKRVVALLDRPSPQREQRIRDIIHEEFVASGVPHRMRGYPGPRGEV